MCARGEWSLANAVRRPTPGAPRTVASARSHPSRPCRVPHPVASLSFLNFLSVIQWFIQRFESCCSAGLSTRSSAEKGPTHRRRRRTHARALRAWFESCVGVATEKRDSRAGVARAPVRARASPANLAVRLREATVYTAALLYVAPCEPAMATGQVVSPAGLTHAQKEKCGRRSNRPAWFNACWASRQDSHALLCV